MNCAACRTELPNEAQFCFSCGYRAGTRPAYEVAETGAGGQPVVLQRRKTVPMGAVARPSPAAAVARAPLPDALAPRFDPQGNLSTKAVEITSTPMIAGGPDNREQRRYALVAEVTLGSEHNFYQGRAENLSAGGLFVSTADPRPVGTEFDVTFELPELDRSCRVRCEVRWVREADPARNLPAGMGLAFAELSRADERAIAVFLQHRDPIFFGPRAT